MRYSIKRIGQRGVTLVELVIAIALLSILAVTISILSVSFSDIVNKNQHKYKEIEELTLSRSLIEKWFYTFDESTNTFALDSDNHLIITKDSVDYKYTIENNKVTFDFLSDFNGTNSIIINNLQDLKFENISNNLYKCTIEHNDKTFSFLLYKNSK